MNDKCKDCDGTGGVDSGASAPWGEFYQIPCQSCHGTGRASVFLIDWAVGLIGTTHYLEGHDKWLAQATEWLDNNIPQNAP